MTAADDDKRQAWPPAGIVWTTPSAWETTVVLLMSSIFYVSMLFVASLFLLLPFTWALALLTTYMTYVWWSRAHVHGWTWRPLARGGLSAAWWSYFDPVVIVEPGLTPGRSYIFGCGPHGIHGFGTGIFIDDASPLYTAAPFLRGRVVGLGAWILFHLPIVRELFLAAGWRDASRPVAAAALREGLSPYILVGGEAEALRSAPGRDDVVVAGRGRRGAARLALAHGAPLVPVYAFRNADTFRTSATCFAARRWLSKTAQVCLPLWAGRAGTPLPYNVRLTVAVGAPVPWPAGYTPPSKPPAGSVGGSASGSATTDSTRVDEALVEAYQAAFVRALCDLFERHKAAASYPLDRKMRVFES